MKKIIVNFYYPLMTFGLFLLLTNSCKKDDNSEPLNTVKDIDGNVYNTVTIGTQTWIKENLKTTKYRNGSAISNIIDDIEWTTQTSGAYCWYDNDIANKTNYGALYNWYTVVDSRNICPTGWHVPTDDEWSTLTNYLGGAMVAGGKLKDTILWQLPNVGADNSSGFSALPGGFRYYDLGYCSTMGQNGYWWSTTEYSTTDAWARGLYFQSSNISKGLNKRAGFSVRCIKDL